MVRTIIPIAFLVIMASACMEQPYTELNGKTMGTYYQVQYQSGVNLQRPIDSLLTEFIAAASTYDSTSELSRFNASGSLVFESQHLPEMLKLATEFHEATRGAFEPTLMPLIRAHGFSTSKRKGLTKREIDSLMSFVSFKHVLISETHMRASKPGVQVDLSALGEGYAIDLIAGFLEAQGINNYKVEIGGEMKCKGKNNKGERWLIGIENPVASGTSRILAKVRLRDEAISTSGKSQKYFIDEHGIKQSHIIDPKTGRSAQNNLLSVTIIDNRAVRADALATALMVMGLDSAKAFAERTGIKSLIVYEANGKVLSWHSPNFSIAKDKSLALR